jgi:hypothetical protein
MACALYTTAAVPWCSCSAAAQPRVQSNEYPLRPDTVVACACYGLCACDTETVGPLAREVLSRELCLLQLGSSIDATTHCNKEMSTKKWFPRGPRARPACLSGPLSPPVPRSGYGTQKGGPRGGLIWARWVGGPTGGKPSGGPSGGPVATAVTLQFAMKPLMRCARARSAGGRWSSPGYGRDRGKIWTGR